MPVATASPQPPRTLGSLLLTRGAVDESLLAAALEEQGETAERIGRILVRRGVDAEAVAAALAEQLRLEYAPPPLRCEPDALALVPRGLALRLRAAPLDGSRRRLRVAMADPLDVGAIDDLQFQTGRSVDPVVASPPAVDRALMAGYGADAVRALVSRIGSTPATEDAATEGDLRALRRASEAAPVIALVDLILARAVAARASDVHLGADGGRYVVRARVDGLLEPLLDVPLTAALPLISRIKIMGGLDIAVKRTPQDGRCSLRVDGRDLAVRVSTLPALDAESVVLRLLDPAVAARGLDELGLPPELEVGLRELVGRRQGLILVTGPTGSGKTTLLYALLGAIDRSVLNVVTLEDPVEYRLASVTQVQIRPRAGLTFAAALRAVLRQDPDVVMVGEIRDSDTVEVALAAALTGHLVLATLHTLDAPGAVARLCEMGAPAYLVAGGLTAVLAQRLVRRLCVHCRAAPAPQETDAGPGGRRAVGCRRCDGRGYSGRIGLFELLTVDDEVRELVLRGASSRAIRDAAVAKGLRPLAEDGIVKVRAGLTTMDEVRPLLASPLPAVAPARSSTKPSPTKPSSS